MITGRQVRAARALLNWTQEMLAEKALVALTA
ncbi:MAG: XRE family transcriptional regulator, partial [Acetobacter aceti]